MNSQNKIPIHVGYMLHIWCDHYYEPDGIVWFTCPHKPEVGQKIKSPTFGHEEYTITHINENEMEIKAK